MASLIRRARPLLVAPLLVLPLMLAPSAALAQAASQAKPATQAEMGLYTRIAAVNTCIARGAGVEFEKAVGIAGETIAQLILGVHGGQIQQVGAKALTLEELRKGSINSAVIGAYELCPKQVPPEVAQKVKDALAKQGGSGGGK